MTKPIRIRPLSNTVSKLSKRVYHWSMTAGPSCLGMTESVCGEICYAMKGFYRMPRNQRLYDAYDELRKTASFTSLVRTQIALEQIDYVRIHTAGDFDSVDYIEKWHNIVAARKTTHFWAYTRSWRDIASEKAGEDLLKPLIALAKLPNFQMWWSCDRDTVAPPRNTPARRAYLAMSDNDLPRYKVDLVFRNERQDYRTSQASTAVCPAERKRATAGEDRVNCFQCRWCFDGLDRLDRFNSKIRGR